MRIEVNISDENVAEFAMAFGYNSNPLDLTNIPAEKFLQSQVADYVRQSVASYRARSAANTAMSTPVQL